MSEASKTSLEDILKDCFILRDLPAENHYAFITAHLIEPLKALAPKAIERKEFEAWMDGLASEIVAGGCLAADPESKSWNEATFRAQRIVKSYKEGRGLFQE